MISGTRLMQIVMLASVCTATISANYDNCGPLERGRWGLLAGIGVAPGFFKNRGFSQAVDPYAGLAACPIDLGQRGTTLDCESVYVALTTPENVFVQNACKAPNFSKLFTNGVLHVTGQLSYNVCENTQYFLEAVYNRATGSCINGTATYVRAPAYCGTGSCSTSCDSSNSCSSSDSCVVTGTPLLALGFSSSLSNYQAYGGYLGARYYWNRVWCDRFALFTGFKFGMLHRKQVCQSLTTPASTATFGTGTTYTFAARTNNVPTFCASNAVSGGLQIGLDYCINDCWSALIGFEFVVTSPFKSSRNFAIANVDPTAPNITVPTGFGNNLNQLSNFLVAPTGCFIQFPIWAGLRWEFDWCRNRCNDC